ncbi:mannitol dehydrogenase family protein [Mameliella alba]|uniref:mannitol dehydrogenase family protein n=1 Tax=Mameliella alba TaxID=561184 RepID=UPI000B5355E6|nr:mannitol dehydrogenase family protein [Mameliella alba]MBY6121969.1 mannitol dehydrogenase family protein [Mameliella alba]OWV39997.1 D-mannonate oxidoreductase [Mameliella alba]OWV58374.1 D-mannonate oxidoreductase [Mameliella alba]
MTRLSTLDQLAQGVRRPGYDPAAHGPGIVHIGLGAFHKAHQALYTDDALAAAGGDWRITGVSLRSLEPAAELTPQNGLFTLIERGVEGSTARIIGAIDRALSLSTDRRAVLDALCDPATRIVSLTVTEKGYGIDRATGGIDRTHPAIAADLADPDDPQGVAGLLVWALRQRRQADTPPFTVLCCDNLPENGTLVRSLLVDFARQTAPDLADHIASDVAFPSTMVDRITPARTEATLALAREMTGVEDHGAIECESFRQWVIEDHFPSGRPAWEAGGAVFVEDVRPFENMKLRMLNGAHSMLAYVGFLAGHRYVRDVMGDPALAALVRRHLAAAAATLPPLPGVDLQAYAGDLATRFANPHLGHETYQIAMDGTEKMPQRIFAAACDALDRAQPLEPFAFATAAWMRYTLGRDEAGQAYDLRDPRSALLTPLPDEPVTPEGLHDRLAAFPDLVPTRLTEAPGWRDAVIARLTVMLDRGMRAAIEADASR